MQLAAARSTWCASARRHASHRAPPPPEPLAPPLTANTHCRDKLTVSSGGHQLILTGAGRGSSLREWARLINEQVVALKLNKRASAAMDFVPRYGGGGKGAAGGGASRAAPSKPTTPQPSNKSKSSGKRLFGRKAPAGPAGGKDGRGSPISVQDFVKGDLAGPVPTRAATEPAQTSAHPLASIEQQGNRAASAKLSERMSNRGSRRSLDEEDGRPRAASEESLGEQSVDEIVDHSDDDETVEHKLIFAIGRRRRLSAWGQDDSD